MNKFGQKLIDEPNSWQDRIFITLDIDWANDLVLKDIPTSYHNMVLELLSLPLMINLWESPVMFK